MPGLCHIASLYRWEVPLSLLDLGTSAGLNLLFDDYGYTYRAAVGDATLTAGPTGSAVALECSARDDLSDLPELRLPTMAERVGPRPLTGRPVLRRRRTVVAGLPVAGQPGAFRPPAGRTGQRARRAATSPARARRHGDRPAPDRRHHAGQQPPRGVPLLGGRLPRRAPAATAGRPRCVRSVRAGRCTTSTARRPSRHPACPRPRRPCRARGPTWPPRWCTSAPRRRTGPAGRHAPARVLDPLVACGRSHIERFLTWGLMFGTCRRHVP